MPGILPPRLITAKIGTSLQSRIAQACDRCRSKKIRCDGVRPSCSQCTAVGFECKTSDKLSRRAFPRGYTESLEERVRSLEAEVRELKDLLDVKDEKIDMLSRMHSFAQPQSRRPSTHKFTPPPSTAESDPGHAHAGDVFKIKQLPALISTDGSEPFFTGHSSVRALLACFQRRLQECARPADIQCELLLPQRPARSLNAPTSKAISVTSLWRAPPRVVSDQLVNIFFQEWASLFPILHRPTFLGLYESYVSNGSEAMDKRALAQLNLVFSIAAISSEKNADFPFASCERPWVAALSTFSMEISLVTVQCLALAQIYCMQKGDYTKLLHYRNLAVGISHRLGLHQSQKRFAFGTLTCETRKKTFWSLYTLDCVISAMLGLPRLIKDHELDCEYPVDADDEYVSEKGFQPSLPGESTKLSSALALFKGIRVLAKTLDQLYLMTATCELSTGSIDALQQDLDDWSSSLPSHLQLTFACDKPSTNVVSSRCPLLGLTYHFIRTMIHRPVAFADTSDRLSPSMLALADSSKHIIQILELLEERNLSFSTCLNKTELLVMCGLGSLLQAMDLAQDSRMLQSCQKTVAAAADMLRARDASVSVEFERIVESALGGNKATPESLASPCVSEFGSSIQIPRQPMSSAEQLQSITERYKAIVAASSASRHASSLPSVSSSGDSMSTSSPKPSSMSSQSQSPVKRFRAIAPSSHSRSPAMQRALASRWTLDSRNGRPRPTEPLHAESRPGSSSTANLNLDYFAFGGDGGSEQSRLPSSDHAVTTNDVANSWIMAATAATPSSCTDGDPFSGWQGVGELPSGDLTDSPGEIPKFDPNSDGWINQSTSIPALRGQHASQHNSQVSFHQQDALGHDDAFALLDSDPALFTLGSLDGSPTDSLGPVSQPQPDL